LSEIEIEIIKFVQNIVVFVKYNIFVPGIIYAFSFLFSLSFSNNVIIILILVTGRSTSVWNMFRQCELFSCYCCSQIQSTRKRKRESAKIFQLYYIYLWIALMYCVYMLCICWFIIGVSQLNNNSIQCGTHILSFNFA
jgi:hypothetical protein